MDERSSASGRTPAGKATTEGHILRVAPPNSLLLIMDPDAGQPPLELHDAALAATDSCIAIGTLCEIDGETTIQLGVEPSAGSPGIAQVFEGQIATPSRRIAVCTALNSVLASIEVTGSLTRVRIWTDDPTEPSQIWIATD
jgi:hypothetical protein